MNVTYTAETIRVKVVKNDAGKINAQVWDSTRYARGETDLKKDEVVQLAGVRALGLAIEADERFSPREKLAIARGYAKAAGPVKLGP